MKRAIIIIASHIIFASVCVLAFWMWHEDGVAPVELTPIRANIIERDPETMTVTELKSEISCYYTAAPGLEAEQIDDDTYRLHASLCDRKWEREARFPRPSRRNFLVGNLTYSYSGGRFLPGGEVLYYRQFWRGLALGGGFGLNQDSAAIRAGAMFNF